MLSFDHLVVAVNDLADASARFRSEYGIVTFPGGVHPIGTMNAANRFSDWSYLELLAVHDSSKDFGAAVERFIRRRGEGLFNWAVRTDDIDAVAERVGAAPVRGSIESPDGQSMGGWRIVSHPEPGGAGAGLPFFIEYDVPEWLVAARPEAARASQSELVEIWRSAAVSGGAVLTEGGIAWVSVRCDRAVLRDWLGDHDLDVRVTSEGPRLSAAGLLVDGREVTIH